MDHARYLRDRAAEFAERAATTLDPRAAENFHQLAILCRDSAARLADRAVAATAGKSAPYRVE